MKTYKLKFNSSFHIDAGTTVDGPSETFINSDTLFSAIVSAATKFYGEEIALEFLKPQSLILSSAFPFYKDEFFLPKPLYYFPKELSNDYEMVKIFKKTKFISTPILVKVLKGESVSEYFKKDFFLDNCWSIRERKSPKDAGNKVDKIFKVTEVPHTVMDRISNQTQIFYKSEVYFNKDGGLYFIAKVKDELLNKFETLLRFLGDEGIGADRTVGKGFFDVEEIENLSLPFNSQSNYYYLLSLYSPTKEEFEKIDPRKSFYDFKIRDGWVSYNTLIRKSTRMFVEGSVLKFTSNEKPVGCIHTVLEKSKNPHHLQYDIVRSGQALFLPVLGGIDDNT